MSTSTLLSLYRDNVLARWIDELEVQFASRGEAFFHVSGIGHAATSALAPYLTPHDWLHCHYRDKALMVARGLSPEAFFLALFCKDASHSRGRQMSAHMSAPELRILSTVGPVGNNALQAAGVAAAIKSSAHDPIVVCCLGDGTTQQGEVLEAIGEAVRSYLPLLFVIEDNRLAISTLTAGRTFYSLPSGDAESFLGIPIVRMDGTRIAECFHRFAGVVDGVRRSRGPGIVVMTMERLTDHTNADDQRVYRDPREIEQAARQSDPLALFANDLIAFGIDPEELKQLNESARRTVTEAAERARSAADPVPCRCARLFSDRPVSAPSQVASSLNGSQEQAEPRTMLEAMRAVLYSWLARDPRVTLSGQDIEDPKGDVFGLTRGLSTAFPGRVTNAPLSESTIVGLAIGRALAGQRPVAMIQFADFLPLAYNQIASELATLEWRTDGGWKAPVVVMAPCGGYKAGLGPFHSQTCDTLMAHLPGLDVMVPSCAEDAAGLLNAALSSERPTVFLYPKALFNDRSLATTRPVESCLTVPGQARVVRTGSDLPLVAWGNTVGICMKAAQALSDGGVEAEVIDLRTLSPWDRDAVIASAQKTRNLVVVHEDNITAGFGAEVAATVAEQALRPVRIRRVARHDTHVPCNFANQLELLPSVRGVLNAAAELLELQLEWPEPEDRGSAADPHLFTMEAFGTSPSDEMVIITHWHVAAGDDVAAGALVADIEADKASGELAAPVSGRIESLLVPKGEMVKVGTPILRIRTSAPVRNTSSALAEVRPVIRKKCSAEPVSVPVIREEVPSLRQKVRVGLSRTFGAPGSAAVRNADLVEAFPERTAEEIINLCGIETRSCIAPGENRLSLAMQAVSRLAEEHPELLQRLGMIVASTGTPDKACPSLACEILRELQQMSPACRAAALDVSAACSGFLYALQIAQDFVQQSPEEAVLVVTSETLTPLIDPSDFSTRIIFGDAAAACLIGTADLLGKAQAFELHRPHLFAKPDPVLTITVPAAPGSGHIRLDGHKVFKEATRSMVEALRAACRASGVEPDQLRLVVPHQANQRILDAVERAAGLDGRVYSNIRHYGNTSSSSIPLCLAELHESVETGALLGLCAFGGGYTYGAALLRKA